MRDGRGQFNMAHAFTTHSRAGDFNATLITHQTLVPHILILATVSLPIAGWAKDGFAEKAVFLRPQATVIDGLRFGDFTIGPFPNLLR